MKRYRYGDGEAKAQVLVNSGPGYVHLFAWTATGDHTELELSPVQAAELAASLFREASNGAVRGGM